ncbi:MAG: class I SAM-dependent DNA methyltransferase, partial [Chloroflexi bacterium]|nr:class I SAM-dependent DNA methyltransferase [Chloroflexota bacterium]
WDAAPERIAQFLTKVVFCLFAEDVGLLPAGLTGRGLFTEVIEQTRDRPSDFVHYAEQLFVAMAEGSKFQYRDIPWFDGRLFEHVAVEELSAEALRALEKACKLDWSAVEPAIFGTLFERSLDPAKRAQLGAHYTRREDILLIVEPVLMAPLRRTWEAIQAEAAPVREKYVDALRTGARATITRFGNELLALRERMLADLRSVTVLDPACGSGNFLYVALQLLKDLEKEVINHPLWLDLPLAFPEVHPRQLYGIEVNPIAHDLASIVVWIGYLQWLDNNGFQHLLKREPILEPLDNIRQMDAILGFDADGSPVEPEWPSVDVIVSNPPFLGGNKMRGELGDEYVGAIRRLYGDRLPGQSDLVTYWFERSRTMISQRQVRRVGLLATKTIQHTVNREVLNRIKATGDIFMAWSDREWVLDGAAVRIAMIGFDDGTETSRVLDGTRVTHISSELKATIDISKALQLEENSGIAFMGDIKGGPFDIPAELARQMLDTPNSSHRDNADVVRPWINATDIVKRPRNRWIIDFGVDMPIEEAVLYELPLRHVENHVHPMRQNNNRKAYRERWWIHVEARPGMRAAIERLSRIIVTPLVSKHRLFVWLRMPVVPDTRLIAIAFSNDYSFGVLHSKAHEIWSLRMGARHGVGDDPTYNTTTCFETFPFPWPPGQEPTDHPAYHAIGAAARQLHEERDAWLNPPGVPESALQQRTLTNLYNALQVFRGEDSGRVVPAAGDFAPRLDALHRALDEAVCDAYGWEYDVLADEEEILRRLLALNLERAARQDSAG